MVDALVVGDSLDSLKMAGPGVVTVADVGGSAKHKQKQQ